MSQAFHDLVTVVARLRDPGGCPWDLEQTHDSLKPFLIEEAYEVLDALDVGDVRRLREELGDLLLQVLLHARIESERNVFDIDDVMADLQRKLIRRHPHVFADDARTASTLTADQVATQWERIKRAERETQRGSASIMSGIPAALPALLRAYHLQTRASRVGFDWNAPEQVTDKLHEELEELRMETVRLTRETGTGSSASPQETSAAIEREFGDVLFTMANIARCLRVNPEEALRKANARFLKRFHSMEQQASQTGRPLHALTAAEWDDLWEAAKRREDATVPPASPHPGNRTHA